MFGAQERNWRFCIGKGYLVLNTRCGSVGFLGRNIVNDNMGGISFGLGDLDLGGVEKYVENSWRSRVLLWVWCVEKFLLI